MASFEEKVQALRNLCERRRARVEGDVDTKRLEPQQEAPAAPLATKEQEAHQRQMVSPAAKAVPSAKEAAQPDADDPVEEADALFCLGHCVERGLHGWDCDNVRAVEFYRLAAERGHTGARWRLGEFFEFGRGVVQSDKEAVQWYRLAAEAGHPQAQTSLALLLEDGRGSERDDTLALHWHIAAAKQDQALSQYCAACCFAEGRGGARDPVEARRWLERSAAAGFPPAVEARSGGRKDFSEEGTAGSDDILGLAARVAAQLGDLDDEDAEAMLDDLLADIPPLIGGEVGSDENR